MQNDLCNLSKIAKVKCKTANIIYVLCKNNLCKIAKVK